MAKLSTCLWFERDGEAAARRYVELVPDSRIDHVQRSPGPWPGGAAGDAILVAFTLGGQRFQALNGGTRADYGVAASISVPCADQAEIDRLWAGLTADGGAEIQCGWLRDRWGVPWQIFPERLPALLGDPDPTVAARVFTAMQGMIKLDIAALERAAQAYDTLSVDPFRKAYHKPARRLSEAEIRIAKQSIGFRMSPRTRHRGPVA